MIHAPAEFWVVENRLQEISAIVLRYSLSFQLIVNGYPLKELSHKECAELRKLTVRFLLDCGISADITVTRPIKGILTSAEVKHPRFYMYGWPTSGSVWWSVVRMFQSSLQRLDTAAVLYLKSREQEVSGV